MKAFTNIFAISLLLYALHPQMAQESLHLRMQNPIAIHKSASSDLFVLDAGGAVHRLREIQDHFEDTSSFSVPGSSNPIDMTYALVNRQDSLIITSFQTNIGTVAHYAANGKLLNFWTLKHVCAGVDFDDLNRAIYVATSDSNEVYRINLGAGGVSYVGEIRDAKRLGPLALDLQGQRIYIADVAEGLIYTLSLKTMKSTVLVSGTSSPSALFFDPQTKRVYIADNGRRKIFMVDTSARKPVLIEFASKPLSSPSGIAPTSDGGFAVADEDTNSVLFFSNQGKFLNRFPK